jgi:6-bladed beta-propeller protein
MTSLFRAALVLSLGGFAVTAAARAPLAAQPGVRQWRLVQDLRIGSENEAASALSRIPALTVGPDDRIYVVQPLAGAVWVFDARGQRVQTIGRHGNGPGEFQNPTGIGWRSDTLWVADGNANRMTLFHDGRPASVLSIAPAWYPLSLTDYGSILVKQNVFDMDIGTGKVTALHYAWLTRAGAASPTFVTLDVRRTGMFVRNPASGHELPNTLRRQPFSDSPLLVTSRDGRRMVLVDRGASSGPRGVFLVRGFDSRGRVLWSTRVPYAAKRLPRQTVEDSIVPHARMVARIPDFGAASEAEAAGWIRSVIYAPRYFPPVSDAVAGRDGTTWLRREPRPSGAVTWMVLDGRGHHVANVDTPGDLRVMEADAGHVWGIVTDAENVPYVVRYAVRK